MASRVLLTGAGGFLGHYVADELRARGATVLTAGRTNSDITLDLATPDAIAEVLAPVMQDPATAPEFVLNCAAMSSMAACQAQPTVALKVNGKSPQALLRATGCRFLQVSTDLVFDGDHAPYDETSVPRPLSVYAMSKVDGEHLTGEDWLVVRVPLLFGKSFDGRRGATDMLRNGVGAKESLVLFTDEYRTPLHAADAARGLIDLLFDPEVRGIRHLPGPERVSRWELAQRFCAVHGIDTAAFRAGTSEDPRRPKDVSLVGAWDPDRRLEASLADA